jgi:sugar phosphate isomerase/epimerase
MSMTTKLAIGSWAYCFGPYADEPVSLEDTAAQLQRIGFDGIELCGFKPHAHPDLYPADSDRQSLKQMLADHGLGICGYAGDFTEAPPATCKIGEYERTFAQQAGLCRDLGIPKMRVDTVDEPPLAAGVDFDTAWRNVVAAFRRGAEIAADHGIRLVWEFEPGFQFNKPSQVLRMIEDVGHDNFSILFDTCHAHMCAVVAARQPEPTETLPGGAVEFAGKLAGQIDHVHLIDSDETLHDEMTSTHAPFGTGVLDFDAIVPAIVDAGYDDAWWSVDLCFWPEAWEVTESAKQFIDALMRRHGL